MKISQLLCAGLIALTSPTLVFAFQSVGNLQGATPFGQAPSVDRDGPFERLSTFPVFLNTDVADETVAEIVTSANGGNTLIYTDSAGETLGFVDITNPSQPQPAGTVDLGGEPTSVAVRGDLALTCVNTSVDYVNTSGVLVVVDVNTHQIVQSLPLGGQPDSIAISPDGCYAAVCIENERDEDLGDGAPPQMPAGFLVIVDLNGAPAQWTTRSVDLTGVADLYPEDPEPEFVDINRYNIAAVTLQENNHCILVRLSNGTILHDFSFGTVDLEQVDIVEDDIITQTGSLTAVPREPDAISWTSPFTLAAANEGDLNGGSRGFTTWTFWGQPLFDSGNTLEHLTASVGHYPEGRSENKGAEPEGVEFARFGSSNYLFIGSERANMVYVYELFYGPLFGNAHPVLVQVLPTGVGPEGLVAIPERDLFVVASEVDSRGDKIRSSVTVYGRTGHANYPDIVSTNRASGEPIAWGALSGLAARNSNKKAFAVHDSFYQQSRIFTLKVRGPKHASQIQAETVITDPKAVLLGALQGLQSNLPGANEFDPNNIVNADRTVNLDLEGIEVGPAGGFWLASEGSGNLVGGVSDPNDRPFKSPNMLLQVTRHGEIVDVVFPPLAVTQEQLRFGFEGVAKSGHFLYVAFQRAWQDAGDASNLTRIGRFDLHSRQWSFAHYPLDSATSPAGGWVGLSELTALDGGRLAVIERDDQGGTDARIKRIYTITPRSLTFRSASEVAQFDVFTKHLASDLIADGAFDSTGGPIPEKLEGFTVLRNGTSLLVNDNDGVDDNSGETRLLRLPDLF